MTEVVLQPVYSPAAQAVMEAFCAPPSRLEHEAYGHIYTRKLGERMHIVDRHEAGPEDVVTAIQYGELSNRSLTFLNLIRLNEPDLWQDALTSRTYARQIEEQFVQQNGAASEEMTALFTSAILEERRLMTRVFNAMPFTDSEADIALAMELCG
jgi:hypothetical protein